MKTLKIREYVLADIMKVEVHLDGEKIEGWEKDNFYEGYNTDSAYKVIKNKSQYENDYTYFFKIN